MDKPKAAALVIAAVVATSVGGFVAGSRVSSPAEVAARTAPPEPSPIFVPVERRVLTADVVTRGTGRFGTPQKLSVATSALKSGPGLVATTAATGADIGEGDLLASASGRPVFVLVGTHPMARDLGPGMAGEDIAQLEAALARLGYDPGAVDGAYDNATASAVTAWYRSKGFAPFDATPQQLASVRAREADLTTATLDVLAAEDSAAAADAAVAANRALVASARQRAEGTARRVEQVRAEAAAANAVAASELRAKQAALDGQVAGGQASAAELAAARAEVTVAEANAAAVRLAGERNVDDALQAAVDAQLEVPAKDAALAAAETAAVNARTARGHRAAAAASIGADTVQLRAQAGVQVPADEVIFVATAPVRVAEVLASPGDAATGAMVRVTDAVVHVEAGVAVADAGLVTPGMAVRVEEPDLGISAGGVVRFVAPTPATNGVDGFHVYVEVSVAAPPPNLVGASVRLTIPVHSTSGPVLAVPASALTLGGDGTTRVERRGPSGATELVRVAAGLAANGLVEVTAPDGSLQEGDLVVVGLGASTGPVATAQARGADGA